MRLPEVFNVIVMQYFAAQNGAQALQESAPNHKVILNRTFGCISSNLLILLRQKLTLPPVADGGKKKADLQPEVIETFRQAAEQEIGIPTEYKQGFLNFKIDK